ncbi:unnamed protein product [Didymodactylos carnosus]|nr:unnamed protein product [Didymodactylos carnosus]CAF4027866.1 unnamed protein product [Didymodactylos carnosus]
MEYLLLQHGCYDLKPFNVLHYNVCSAHPQPLDNRNFSVCSVCQPCFDRQQRGRSRIRSIGKLDGLTIWKMKKISMFGKPICETCRQELRKHHVTPEIKQESRELFQWLYDENIVHTPTTISSSQSNQYEQIKTIFSQLARENQQTLRDSLRSMNYQQEIPTTFSYNGRTFKSKKNFCHSATKILQFILQTLAPNDSAQIWEDIIESSYRSGNGTNINMDRNFEIIMQGLAESYQNCEHWSTKRQILSTFAKDVPLSIIQKFIPDLTPYRFTKAGEQADYFGKGTVVDTSRQPTVRYTDEQVAHFVQFISSPHVSTDLPFGQKTLKLSTGEEISISNVIRNMIPSRIIDQYLSYCLEMSPGFQPVKKSSLYSILHECAESTRTSLQGLDYFTADGSSSFDILITIVDDLQRLGLSTSDATSIKKNLQASKNYLKTDYKTHVQRHSSISDHCSTFALSDTSEKSWREECDHDHDDVCDRCELLKETIQSIECGINKLNETKIRERLLHRLNHHARCINAWKAHQLRLVHQDYARTVLLQQMEGNTIFVYIDWAMKWLPTAYREAQRDFFAKRGLSWHVAYIIRKVSTNDRSTSSASQQTTAGEAASVYQHKTFVHIFDQCIQNGKTVISVLQHIFLQIKQEFPQIKYAHIRADNAGCYHGSETLLAMSKLAQDTGVWIKSVDF